MAGLYGILNIGQSALIAEQTALSTTSQNIANVNTPGYTRQEAVFETTPAVNDLSMPTGTGVQIGEIRRVVDRFIETQITSENATLGRSQIDQSVLGRVEAVFNEAQGAGINQAVSNFFASLQDLANSPQGATERAALLSRAGTMTQQFAAADSQLQQIRKDLNTEIVGKINDVNTLTGQIADLNNQISRTEVNGQKANDLRDERGRLLNELAQKVDISVIEDAQGSSNIMIAGGKPLVEADKAFSLRGVADPANLGFVKVVFDAGTGSTTDITAAIGNGELKGLIDLRDNVIPGYIGRLDQLASSIVTEVNAQHRLGFDLTGTAGGDFFAPTPAVSGAAGSMAVAVIDPKMIAAAGSASGAPGDNSNALRLAQLQGKSVAALGDTTFQNSYGSLVGDIGGKSQFAQSSVSAQGVVMNQLASQRDQVSGVSLDAEVTNLLIFERAYQAAARIISMADQLLQTVIAMKV